MCRVEVRSGLLGVWCSKGGEGGVAARLRGVRQRPEQDTAYLRGWMSGQTTEEGGGSWDVDVGMKDEEFVREAMREAVAAEEAGEVPVGAVVVLGGRVVGAGQNRVIRDADPTAHAEVVALRAAGRAVGNYRLEGCTLYATLEPCAMCAGAILHARIARLVYGASDAKAGACGSVLEVMNHPALNHRVVVEAGVLGEECGGMLTRFFQERRQRGGGGRIQAGEGC